MDTRTDMSHEFREAATRLFGDIVTPQRLETAEAGSLPPELWSAIQDAGFGLLLVPEAQGGIGAGLPEAAAVLQVAGEHAVPGPLLELMLGNELLARAGHAPLADPLALAFAAGPAGGARATTLRNVPWADAATTLLVVGRGKAGSELAVVPAAQLVWQAEVADASGEPLARVDVPGDIEWRPLPGLGFDQDLARAGLLRGAQMMGAMRWCLQRTTAYALERKQFGREIAKFQVVQQMVAEMASVVVAAQAMLDAAVADPTNLTAVAAARSRLGDAVDTVFAHAHQVHGAIGFSQEYVLHYRTRRLMAWRDQFGTVAHWRRVLAAQFVGKRADEVWPALAG
jgi:acyl-CoA dehydrogenase